MEKAISEGTIRLRIEGKNGCSSHKELLLLKVQPAWKHWKCHRVLAKLHAGVSQSKHTLLKGMCFFFFFFSKGMWQCLTRTMFTNGTGLFENVGVHGRNFLACKRTKAENGQRPNIHPAQRAVGHSIGMQDTSPNKILRLLMQQHTTCLFQEHCQPIDEAAREKYKHQTFRWTHARWTSCQC